MVEYKIGSLSSKLLLMVLVVFGILVVNPSILQGYIGDILWVRWGLSITAFLIVFGNYLYPRIKEIATTGTLKVNNGDISTFFATILGLFATIGFLYPDAIVQFLGNMGLGSYSTTVIYFLGAVYDYMNPRNTTNSIEPVVIENIVSGVNTEAVPVDTSEDDIEQP
jgi:hypothetical protein